MTEDDLQQLLKEQQAPAWRQRLAMLIESSRFQWSITTVILVNALALGIEATPFADSVIGQVARVIDSICLIIFIVELTLKSLAYRFHMLRNGWNNFDIAVVAIALLPASGTMSVLRSLRVLRVLRLLTVVPSLRRVVAAFLHAIPGLVSVIGLMGVLFYVAAVMATGFFGESHPSWFGNLGRSFYTLFQIMTLESWSMGIVRPIMETHTWAWAFFIPFIVFATFTILNLFIGVIVSTMQEIGTQHQFEVTEKDTDETTIDSEFASILASIKKLEHDLEALRSRSSKQDEI